MTDADALLLRTALTHRIVEPNVDAGFERFSALTGGALDLGAFRDAVAACVADRLIHDPVRLTEGALQCHWHLELTPAGVEMARLRAS